MQNATGTESGIENDDERRIGPVFRAPRSHHRTLRNDHPAGSSVRGDHERTREREQPVDDPQEARA